MIFAHLPMGHCKSAMFYLGADGQRALDDWRREQQEAIERAALDAAPLRHMVEADYE